MKKLIFTSFLLFILTGCQKEGANPIDIYPISEIEADFVQFSDKFLEYHDNLGLTHDYRVSILMSEDLDDTTYGTCLKVEGDDRRVILINDIAWGRMTSAEKELVIFHELGHCILNLPHNSNTVVARIGGLPESIMFPKIFSDVVYVVNRDYYVADLFEPSQVEEIFNVNFYYVANELTYYNEDLFVSENYPDYVTAGISAKTSYKAYSSTEQHSHEGGCGSE